MLITFSPLNFLSSLAQWIPNPFTEQEVTELPSCPRPSKAEALAKMYEEENIRRGQEQMKDLKPVGLREKLNLGTRKVHDEAHENLFLKSIAEGDFDPQLYKQYLVNLKVVHEALESAEKKIQNTALGHFVFPKLWRVEALKSDIEDWEVDSEYYQPTLAAKNYAARLFEIAEKEPDSLIPHLYTIYGGLFFGGQVFKNKVKKVFIEYMRFQSKSVNYYGNLYYSFSNISDVQTFKKTWRQHLDEIPQKLGLTEEQLKLKEEKWIEEANCAFRALITIAQEEASSKE